MKFLVLFFSVGLLVSQVTIPVQAPAGQNSSPFGVAAGYMDNTITSAIADGELPGAVVLLGHNGKIVYEKAYGWRALVPTREPMTLDTIFDAASLTKVLATTPSMMKLVERGQVRLNDLVTRYLPEFEGGKTEITVRELMTHYSGLRPDLDLTPEWSGYQAGIKKALGEYPIVPPATRFIYSDINFILLGEIVHRVSGKPLDEFAHDEIFQPLGMKETTYLPPASWKPRIAPTEIPPGEQMPLRGVVHDETTRFMGGVAGHAGVFTTAADLAKYAQMLLNLGEYNGVRLFSPITVQTMTSPQSPVDQIAKRGLGWDVDSPFSGNRGDLFPRGSFGHTGFTGTSLWVDPVTHTYVILMANSVHPHRKAAITSLRGRVASVAAAGLNLKLPEGSENARPAQPLPPSRPREVDLDTLTGLDVLVSENFASLRGKHIGLITNHTGVTRDGKPNALVMKDAGIDVRALLSPEHGILGKEDTEIIGNARDAMTGLPVYSLYSGPNRRPTDEMLQGVDTLVFDIQDVGTRFYTYICTMTYAMEEAAKRNIEFVVLDRPNPITGEHVEGPMLDPSAKSFVGCVTLPVRHGMTAGEIAQMYNDEMPLKARLRVIAMRNWRRSAWWDNTDLPWINPSPNMRSLNAALLYPGIGMFEYATNYSVGRGTDAPFEQIGADWIQGRQLADYLNERRIPGIRVYPTRFTPTASNFSGTTIDGVRFVITDRDAFDSTRFGLELAAALNKLFPGQMPFTANERLVGSRDLLEKLAQGASAQTILESDRPGLERFLNQRAKYLLY